MFYALSDKFSFIIITFNSFSKQQNFSMSKLKASADNKIKVAAKLKFVLGRVENIVAKGENAGYQHFLLFPQCFKGLLPQGCKNSVVCVKRLVAFQLLSANASIWTSLKYNLVGDSELNLFTHLGLCPVL